MTSYRSKINNLRSRVNNHLVAQPVHDTEVIAPKIASSAVWLKSVLVYIIAPVASLLILLLWRPLIVTSQYSAKTAAGIVNKRKISIGKVIATVGVFSLVANCILYFLARR
jgi:hypothetical protein